MQVSFSIWFQELFSNFYDFFDFFFCFFTFFGQELFLILLFAILYWVVNKKLAMIVATSALTSIIANGALKEICKVERPISNPDIRFVEVDNIFVNTLDLTNSYSFPSGHAMSAATTFSSLGFCLKNKKMWILSAAMILLVCASRIYLGVHWLFDVTIGAILGIVIAYLMYRLFIKLKDKEIFIYLTIMLISLILLFFSSNNDSFKGIGAVIGFCGGAMFEHKFVRFDPTSGTVLKKVIRVLIGVICLLAIKEGVKYLFNLIDSSIAIFHGIRYFLIAFFGVGLYPMIFKKINL